ncbi:aspartyl-phosphate phosphatase Spo0E family protein [Bacillus sp. FJAT-45350]|uniref:aspartyl-phosphate phosphatase Spo0E family protein n=1 Tax=Bacillus sp. FJAT-45350 TaxID=2011014 RepID=UPI000BB8AA90|nr:aspartyl-phosphate phosphatase Spo0E family protein [Bacillus sp. FJAT-45350]
MTNQKVVIIKLENTIHSLRNRMISTGMKKGLTHPETIKYSRQLDEYLNKYDRIKSLKVKV